MTGPHETTANDGITNDGVTNDGITNDTTPPPSGQVTLEPRIAACLKRYRVSAYVVGVGLLFLCVAVVLDWGFGMPAMAAIVGPLHGFLYMVYLALAVDFALKARWSIAGTIGVLLAGTIPFVSFIVERAVTRRVLAGRGV